MTSFFSHKFHLVRLFVDIRIEVYNPHALALFLILFSNIDYYIPL